MKKSLTKTCKDLLEMIDKQNDVIGEQNRIIARLVNENVEQENLISELMKESVKLSYWFITQ